MTSRLLPRSHHGEIVAFSVASQRASNPSYFVLTSRTSRMTADGADVHGLYRDALQSLYRGEDARLQRIAKSFAPLIVSGQIMGVETAVVKEAFDRLIEEGVEEALDDFKQVGEEILDFIEAKRGSSIPEARESEFEDDTGEQHTYQHRDGWYWVDEDGREMVGLTAKTMSKNFFAMGQRKVYEWLSKKGVVKRRAGQSGYTSKVPHLARFASAVRIDVEALRRVVGRE